VQGTLACRCDEQAGGGRIGGSDEIRAAYCEILGGLLPGVILVPAMLVTLAQLQSAASGI
jgi:hypothetical protein